MHHKVQKGIIKWYQNYSLAVEKEHLYHTINQNLHGVNIFNINNEKLKKKNPSEIVPYYMETKLYKEPK